MLPAQNPNGVTVSAAGNVYVADYDNQRIRLVTPSGATSTLAGSGAGAFADGVGAAARFYVRFFTHSQFLWFSPAPR